MNDDKKAAIRKIIAESREQVESLARNNNERTKEILESIEARTDAKVAQSIALSIDLMRLLMQMLTVIGKTDAPEGLVKELGGMCSDIHARVTTQMVMLSSDDEKVIDRELDCMSKLMDANVANLKQIEELSVVIGKRIQTVMQGD